MPLNTEMFWTQENVINMDGQNHKWNVSFLKHNSEKVHSDVLD